MADIGERSEQPTGRRLEEASKKGQVPYSKELTGALMFLIILAGLRLFGGDLIQQLREILRVMFSLEGFTHVGLGGIVGILGGVSERIMAMLMPIFLLVLAITLASGFMQIGVTIHFERIKARWSKLNPVGGVKKLFSVRSVFTVGLSILKLVAVTIVVWTGMQELVPRARVLNTSSASEMAALFVEGVFMIGFRVGALVLLLAIIDLFWTRYRHTKDLMMTKEEVKEERKQSEGNPEVKGKIKAIQKEVALARMMKDVKTATVVVRNPTHFAVALRYDRSRDPSPRVVAKGKNLIARRIIQIAEEAGVPVRTEPPLARQLYHTVKLGHLVPEELFRAVARILAWVYKHEKRRVA